MEDPIPVTVDQRGRPRVQTVNDLPSKTVQSDAQESDIRFILAKFGQTGVIQQLDATQAEYVDVTAFTDYADVMRTVREAENNFRRLPSKVREVFNHDVAEWLDTAHDKEKRDALLATGLFGPSGDAGGVAVPAAGVGSAEGGSGSVSTPEGGEAPRGGGAEASPEA
jgi:phage internal scaffolding protein